MKIFEERLSTTGKGVSFCLIERMETKREMEGRVQRLQKPHLVKNVWSDRRSGRHMLQI